MYSRFYLVLTLMSMIGLALPSDHGASVTTRKLSKGSKKNPPLLFQEQIPIKMEAPKMMSVQQVEATVAEVVNEILNDDQRRGLHYFYSPVYYPDWFSVKTTGMTETECTDPEAECEKNSDSTGYRWCGSTQTCVPPGDPFPLSCFTDAPLTPEEECEKNSDSTGYRWCGSTQTCVPPGGDFPPSCFTGIACYKAIIAIESKVALRPNAIANLKDLLVTGVTRNSVSVTLTLVVYGAL